MKRGTKKNNKSKLKVLLGALALVLIGTGAYYWSVQSQSGSSKTEEVKKDTNSTQETTSSNKVEPSTSSNEKQEQTTNQQTPTNQQAPTNQQTTKQEQPTEASTSGADTVKWESKGKALQGDVVTVTKDTPVDLFEYFEVADITPGTRGYIVEFSDLSAVEVTQEAPNGTPTTVKFKSDTTVTVIAAKNKLNIQFKVK